MKKIIIFIIFIFISVNIVFARAWWWGSSSSSSSSSGHSSGGDSRFITIIVWGMFSLVWYIYYLRRKRIKKAKEDQQNAILQDSTWSEEMLKSMVENTFMEYQKARANKNLETVKNLFLEEYYLQAKAKMDQDLAWKTNILENIKINSMNLLEVKDLHGKEWDVFCMEIKASMIDYFIDDQTWKVILRIENDRYLSEEQTKIFITNFVESWSFIRINGNWLLFDISQWFYIYTVVNLLPDKYKKNYVDEEKNSNSNINKNNTSNNNKNTNLPDNMKLW